MPRRSTGPYCHGRFPAEVNIPIALAKSLAGRYFVGHADVRFGCGKYGWAALVNPCKSGIDLHANVYTITNDTDVPFTAQLWFNPKLAGRAAVSKNVSPTNTALDPLPRPEVILAYAGDVPVQPCHGVFVYERRVPPQGTVVSEEDGKNIFPPGGVFAISLVPPDGGPISAQVAMGWWEAPRWRRRCREL